MPISPAHHFCQPPNGPLTGIYPLETASQPLFQPHLKPLEPPFPSKACLEGGGGVWVPHTYMSRNDPHGTLVVLGGVSARGPIDLVIGQPLLPPEGLCDTRDTPFRPSQSAIPGGHDVHSSRRLNKRRVGGRGWGEESNMLVLSDPLVALIPEMPSSISPHLGSGPPPAAGSWVTGSCGAGGGATEAGQP